MCGIAGIVALDSTRQITADELDRMIACMPYRGPDARGSRLYGHRIGLAHLRLSILDLRPESNQPFEIDGGDYAITYNGEIFNYLELRAELESLGHAFRTTSDTEVLLRAYAQWGAAAVPRFNGMWAFAIYDRRRDLLFCSRDRFGIKPFNYAVGQGRFLFASEAKAILTVAPDLAQPNYDSLSRLLRASIGARLADTCFEGIKRLLPAHNLTVQNGNIRMERYWNYPSANESSPKNAAAKPTATQRIDYSNRVLFAPSKDRLTEAEAARGLRAELIDSLRLRLRSDVPIGITLSGGVDSSSIACLVRTLSDRRLETFTASFPGESFDEAPRAAALAESLGMNPNPVPVRPDDVLPLLRTIIWHLENPIHTPAVLPLWFIMEAARRKVTVVLEGQGADELLAGYYTNFITAATDRLTGGQPLAALAELGWEMRRVGLLRSILLAGRAIGPQWSHRLFRRARGDEQIYIGPLAAGPHDEPTGDDLPVAGDRLNRSLIEQHQGRLVDLLHYGDAISMAHSIESRLPFLDHRLVEYSCRLPGSFKYAHGHGKAVLKNAVRGDVPADILNTRKKLGFVVPISRWFRERPEVTVYPVLRSEACRRRGIFDPQRLDAALERHRSRRVDLSNNIYRWIMTELWFQVFIDRG